MRRFSRRRVSVNGKKHSRATMGSTCLGRRVGMLHAANATTASIAAMPATLRNRLASRGRGGQPLRVQARETACNEFPGKRTTQAERGHSHSKGSAFANTQTSFPQEEK